MPVLVRSGTVESRYPEWLTDPAKRNTTLAPLLYYRLDADLIPLPWSLDGQASRDYMERIVAETLAPAERFILIARAFGDEGVLAAWLRGRLGPLGFCVRPLGDFGRVGAMLFERTVTGR